MSHHRKCSWKKPWNLEAATLWATLSDSWMASDTVELLIDYRAKPRGTSCSVCTAWKNDYRFVNTGRFILLERRPGWGVLLKNHYLLNAVCNMGENSGCACDFQKGLPQDINEDTESLRRAIKFNLKDFYLGKLTNYVGHFQLPHLPVEFNSRENTHLFWLNIWRSPQAICLLQIFAISCWAGSVHSSCVRLFTENGCPRF